MPTARCRIWNTGSGALVRTIELDEGAATALAVDDRRALTGHKGGAVVLWDLERAEKLAVVQHRAPISSLVFTGDPNRFFAASQDGSVSLFDVRSPNTPAPLSDDVETGAQMLALARSRGLLVTGGQDRNIRLWRTENHGLQRTWRTNTEGIVALDIAPDRTHHRQRGGRRLGPPLDHLVLARAAYAQRSPGTRHRARLRAERRLAGNRRRGRRRQALEHPQRPPARARCAATPGRCARSASPPTASA